MNTYEYVSLAFYWLHVDSLLRDIEWTNDISLCPDVVSITKKTVKKREHWVQLPLFVLET